MPTKMKRAVTKRRSIPTLPAGVECDLVRSIDRAPRIHDLDAIVKRVESLLGREGRRPVLVGPPEVGKTAIVWGLAKRIAEGARPAGARAIWEVSLRSLDMAYGKEAGAGTRLGEILREAATSSQKPIVFISDLRMLRAVEADHALIEALAHTNVAFLGEAWPGFASWLADDSELAAVTHVVRVEEPSIAATLSLLSREALAIERANGPTIETAALERLVHDVDRLQPQRRLPGKAFALLDEVVREASSRDASLVTPAHVSDRVCESLRLPRFLVDPSTAFDASRVRSHLASAVVGQDEAINAVVERLALYKAEMCDPTRPLGTLLLAGPSGVGKSQIAQEIATYVFGGPQRLVRISLADHSEDWKVDQLFGQRGSASIEARRGVLTRQLAGKPFAVLLLDEIEKAHPLAYKNLLRPFDEGVFVNGNDELISLRNTLIIVTTSIGADLYRDAGVGFARPDAAAAGGESVRKRVADSFPADLLDRFDRICVCPPFGTSVARSYARREVDRALTRAQIARHGVEIDVTDRALDGVVAEERRISGTVTAARGLRRALEQHIVAPLALALLEPASAGLKRIQIDWIDGAVVLVRPAEAVHTVRVSRTPSRAHEALSSSRRIDEVAAPIAAGARPTRPA